jgi:hypothetical protein
MPNENMFMISKEELKKLCWDEDLKMADIGQIMSDVLARPYVEKGAIETVITAIGRILKVIYIEVAHAVDKATEPQAPKNKKGNGGKKP